MNQETWKKLDRIAASLGYELCNDDRQDILKNVVCFHLIVQGNLEGALRHWFGK